MPFLRRTNARARAAALATGAAHALLLRLALPVALALLAAGCTEELPPVGSLSDIGVVEGRVIEAGQPLAAQVRFEYAQDNPVRATVTVQADSTGWYHAELPLGRYYCRLRYGNASAPSNSSVDTVAVGRAVRRLDLRRGRAVVTIRIPAEAETVAASLEVNGQVVRTDGGQAHYTGRATCQVDDETATFDLRLLPPTAYTMSLDCQGGPYDVMIPRAGATNAPDSLRVGLDSVAQHAFDFRSRLAMVDGLVTSCPGVSRGSFTARLLGQSGRLLTEGSCLADGTFHLVVLNPEPARLRVDHEYLSQWYGGRDQTSADVLDLRQGSRLEGFAFVGGGLRLRFQGPGEQLENSADVALVDPYGETHPINNYFHGDLTIANLAPGAWRLRIPGGCNAEPWLPRWWEHAADQADATPLEIAAGGLLELDVALEEGGTVRGTFVRGSDEWFWGVDIYLHDLAGAKLCWHTTGYLDDGFAVRGVPDGTYLLGMYVNSLPWWYPGTWDREQAQAVTVTGAGVVEGLAWTLPFPYKGARP